MVDLLALIYVSLFHVYVFHACTKKQGKYDVGPSRHSSVLTDSGWIAL